MAALNKLSNYHITKKRHVSTNDFIKMLKEAENLKNMIRNTIRRNIKIGLYLKRHMVVEEKVYLRYTKSKGW